MRPAPRAAYNRPVLRIRLAPRRLGLVRRLAAVVAIAGVIASLAGPPLAAEETWRDSADVSVSYTIDANLPYASPGEPCRISAEEVIRWKNTSDEDVAVVLLHLYANAFRNTRSSFLREAAREGWDVPEDMVWGRIDITRIWLGAGDDLALEFLPSEDGNVDDRTVARVALPAAVRPGGTLELHVKFATTLPTVVARMGHKDDFVMAAQWYPKLGRYLGRDSTLPGVRDGWYCPAYHRNGEFHADFADYEVTLELSDELVTGATGRRVASQLEERSLRRTETWEAKSVVDFAWVADRRFLDDGEGPPGITREVDPMTAPEGTDPAADPVLRERDRVAGLLGVLPDELRLPTVRVTLLLQPEHERQADRHFEAARVALGMLGLWFGPYPYEELTIVDPAHGARRVGGMEYPQLVTAGTHVSSPREAQHPESVIVHEIGHQWFMNVLASNEAHEAWLDEGLTTYFTACAMDAAYGSPLGVHRKLGIPFVVTPFMEFAGLGSGWPEWIGLPSWMHPPELEILDLWRDLPPLTALPTPRYTDDPIEPRRRSYLRRAGWDELVLPSWKYLDRASYGANAYSRPALFLATLRRTLCSRLGAEAGERAFLLGMQRYARDWRFRHPTTPDFLAAFEAGSGLVIRPLATALLQSSGTLDYAIESIETRSEPDLLGWEDDDGTPVLVGPGDAPRAPSSRRSFVLVRRRGEVIAPVRLQVTRDDGPVDEVTWKTAEWDGRERWKRFDFDGEIVAARLHPDAEYLQDVDRRNDSRKADLDGRPGVKWAVRFLLWLENAALSYGRFL